MELGTVHIIISFILLCRIDKYIIECLLVTE